MAFEIDRFMDLSKAVDLSDMDWEYVARVGVTDDEAKCLRYMADIESHTILYLRDLLAGHTSRDAEVTSFLSCWVYEETYHGRAIDKLLTVAGRPPEANRYEKTSEGASWREDLEAFLSHSAAKATKHFAAAHMAWGAINEMMAASAYTQLARHTKNKELSKLLLKLSKDERRHQSFYYSQAEKRLAASPVARFLAKLALSRFWTPVGMGVGEADGIQFIASFLYDDENGAQELRHMDRAMQKLPGLEWWNKGYEMVSGAMKEFETTNPVKAKALRAYKDEVRAGMTPEQLAVG